MLDRLIERVAKKAISQTINRHLDTAIHRAMKNSPRFQFVKAMQMQMLGADPTMDPREAWRIAVNTLRQHLADEGIKFGDPAHDWTRAGAVTLIHEYEIHYWEPAP